MNRKLVIIIITQILCILSETIIDVQSNNIWTDDFLCDLSGTGNNGWSDGNGCLFHNNQYHGRFSDITNTELIRTYKCSKYSTVYVSFSVAFDCLSNSPDGVILYYNNDISLPMSTIKLTPANARNSTNPTIPVSSLPQYADQCTNPIIQPWNVLHSHLNNFGQIEPNKTFQLKWIASTTQNGGIIIYNISIKCSTNTTTNPTIPMGNISYTWTTYIPLENKGFMGGLFIHDAYNKFEIQTTMQFNSLKSLNKLRWEYMEINNTNWTEISIEYYKNINIYTAQIVDKNRLIQLGFDTDALVYTSILTINAIRSLNSGYCYNITTALKHLLQPGKRYMFRLYVIANSIINNNNEYFYSDVLSLTTNQFATNGECILQLLDKTIANNTMNLFDQFYLQCIGWDDTDSLNSNFSLRFNILMNDVLVNNALSSESWNENPETIIGIVGTTSLEIKALIRDDLGAITCYDIEIDYLFPSASISDKEIMESINGIIRENKLGQHNSIAVVLNSILEDLLYIGYANDDVLAYTMGLIVNNVIDTSFATNPLETSSGRILSELAMMKGLFSEHRLIFSDSVPLMIDLYLPLLFSIIDEVIITAIDLDQSIGDSLYQIGLNSLILSDTLEIFMTSKGLEQFEMNHNKILETFIEFAAYSGHITLAQSYPGAQFEYFNKELKKKIFTKKIDPGTNSTHIQNCGISDGNNIRIPPIFNHFYDCSFVEQESIFFQPDNDNNFKLIEKDRNKILSNTVTINLYNGDVYNSVFDYQRRTSIIDLSTSLLPSIEIKDRCNPYFVTIYLNQNEDRLYTLKNREQNTYKLGENIAYPVCEFWNITIQTWDTNNCFVINYTENEVVCACQNLATFNVKASYFKPLVSMITIYDFRSLSKDNLLKYPMIWIILLSILLLFLIICIIDACYCNKDNLSPLAYKDIMFSPVKNHKIQSFLPSITSNIFEQLYTGKHKYYGVGLIQSIRKDNKLCSNQLKLYKIYLRDTHTLLSMFQHNDGTNYSKRERIATFYVYLCTIMASSAVFYGLEKQELYDITASFLISLWSTIPALFVKFSFKKARPTITPITINIHGIKKQMINQTDLSRLPINVEGNILTNNDIKRYNELYEKLESHTQFKFFNKTMVDEMNEIVIKTKHLPFRMAFLDRIRAKLLLKHHGWPHCMKMFAWIFLILWCLICALLIIIYGIQFDLKYEINKTNEYTKERYDEECYDLNPQLVINQQLTAQQIKENKKYLNDNYGIYMNDSLSWLLQIFESLILSILLWQPFIIYIITWLHIWLFSWNLSISILPFNLIQLFRNVFKIQTKTRELEEHLNEIIELQTVTSSEINLKQKETNPTIISDNIVIVTSSQLKSKDKKNKKNKINEKKKLKNNHDQMIKIKHMTSHGQNTEYNKGTLKGKEHKINKNIKRKKRSNSVIIDRTKHKKTNNNNQNSSEKKKSKNVRTKKKRIKRSQTMIGMSKKSKNNRQKLNKTEKISSKAHPNIKVRKKRAKTMTASTFKRSKTVKKRKKQNENNIKKKQIKKEEKEQKDDKKDEKSQNIKKDKNDRIKPNTINSKKKSSKTVKQTETSVEPKKTNKNIANKSQKIKKGNKINKNTKKKKKKKADPFVNVTSISLVSKQVIIDTIIRYKAASPYGESPLYSPGVDSFEGDVKIDVDNDEDSDIEVKYDNNKPNPQRKSHKLNKLETIMRTPIVSPFNFAVEKSLNKLFQPQQEIKPKENNHSNELYKNIVSHQFRPFDVYAFFGSEYYFLEIVKTWYGLDIKGYEKPKPPEESSHEEQKVEIIIPKKAPAPWKSAVSYAD